MREKKNNNHCPETGHQPTDYSDFCGMVINIRPWPGMPLDVGECPRCQSTISYPRTGTPAEFIANFELVAA